ncbi:MAG: hypothetical protein DMF87_24215 [Acidobacteria bacterium]|nr:MAG: hypothetical protein DMF87_24215 [Acidobacteriota bacterium]
MSQKAKKIGLTCVVLVLAGFVQGEPARKRDSLEYRFDVQSNGKVVRAYYTGIVPDTFKADSEVVLKGRLETDGTFHVVKDGVMAKCPSKYDPAKLPPASSTSGATPPSTGTN